MTNSIGQRQQQILTLLLKEKKGLCIDDIAKRLAISRNAVQQHMSSLALEGLICVDAVNKTLGRPVRRYVLTTAGINSFPKQYAWFSELMLTTLKAEIGATAFERYMKRLGEDLSAKYAYRFIGKSDGEKRNELLNLMEEIGYKTIHPEDQQTNTNTIKAYNCVFHDIAQKHQEICQFDIALMSALLGKKIDLIECMAKKNGLCCFEIQNYKKTID
jgi:predicted ArsR family transcriptional regulator